MSITLEQKLKVLREVESIYALSKKWQRLTPNEKRPNWEGIADAVLKKALGKPIQGPPQRMHIEASAMHHDQDARTARVVERTLKNGMVPPDVLHSFQHGIVTRAPVEGYPKPPPLDHDPALPDIDVYVHDAGQTIVPASHYEPAQDRYHPAEHEPDSHVPPSPAPKQPEQARLPSSYEAVH